MTTAYKNATRRRGKRQRGGGFTAQPRQGGDTVMTPAYRTTLPRRTLVSGVGWWQLTSFSAIMADRNTTNKTRRPCACNTRNGANQSQGEARDGYK